VGLLMHNSNPFLETYFALSKIGAVLVLLNTRLWSTSAAVIRLGEAHFGHCQTGDSLIFCPYQKGSYIRAQPITRP
jgi:acyl-CoA synthetase (AMP-forming)/AMP-acid ligase II